MKKTQYCTPSVKICNMGVATIICASGNTVTSTTGEFEYGAAAAAPPAPDSTTHGKMMKTNSLPRQKDQAASST